MNKKQALFEARARRAWDQYEAAKKELDRAERRIMAIRSRCVHRWKAVSQNGRPYEPKPGHRDWRNQICIVCGLSSESYPDK